MTLRSGWQWPRRSWLCDGLIFQVVTVRRPPTALTCMVSKCKVKSPPNFHGFQHHVFRGSVIIIRLGHLPQHASGSALLWSNCCCVRAGCGNLAALDTDETQPVDIMQVPTMSMQKEVAVVGDWRPADEQRIAYQGPKQVRAATETKVMGQEYTPTDEARGN